jgi:hypothetical protein
MGAASDSVNLISHWQRGQEIMGSVISISQRNEPVPSPKPAALSIILPKHFDGGMFSMEPGSQLTREKTSSTG